MRVKTDTRRQAIIAHAGAVFRECGYERASMSHIAARVGGSKATLYGYFRSKQDLLLAVMEAASESHVEALMALLDERAEDPRRALEAFGHAYLELMLSPEIVAANRIGIAEGECKAIGELIYDQGPRRGRALITAHLQRWIDRNIIRPADPKIISLHLLALLEAGVVEPALFGATPDLTREEAVQAATDAFLKIYAT